MNTSIDTERRLALEVYPKRDICIVRGEGALLWDDQGNEYIDCTAGIGIANIGYARPTVVRLLPPLAISKEQLSRACDAPLACMSP